MTITFAKIAFIASKKFSNVEGFPLTLVDLTLFTLKVFFLPTGLMELDVSGLVISKVRITSE